MSNELDGTVILSEASRIIKRDLGKALGQADRDKLNLLIEIVGFLALEPSSAPTGECQECAGLEEENASVLMHCRSLDGEKRLLEEHNHILNELTETQRGIIDEQRLQIDLLAQRAASPSDADIAEASADEDDVASREWMSEKREDEADQLEREFVESLPRASGSRTLNEMLGTEREELGNGKPGGDSANVQLTPAQRKGRSKKASEPEARNEGVIDAQVTVPEPSSDNPPVANQEGEHSPGEPAAGISVEDGKSPERDPYHVEKRGINDPRKLTPQALAQCIRWIAEGVPSVAKTEHLLTDEGVKWIADTHAARIKRIRNCRFAYLVTAAMQEILGELIAEAKAVQA